MGGLITARASDSRRRLEPLDGVRAFAIASVLLFHAGVSWVNGGLLGVDVFFVLSGFLITSLLCDEQVRSGTIALGRFWAGRARRLLPGLVLLLIGVALYAHVFGSSLDLGTVRGDALATLAYVSNWHFILSDQGYFVRTGVPSPLLHTWSLAVEEQYYLIWPLVALPVLRWRGPRMLAAVAAAAAVCSATAMAVMYHAGVSVDRLYYGTDTRAQALLVGSFLGAVAARGSWRVFPETWCSTRHGRVAGAALAVVGGGTLVWAWHAFDGNGSFLYSGGFFLVALAAAAVIAHVVSWRNSILARLLSLGAVTFVGRISYGLYLYHWPLFLVIDHAHTGLEGTVLLVVRVAATMAVATASYYLVEVPVRTGRFFRSFRSLAATGIAVAVTSMVLVVSTVAPTAVDAAPRGAPPPGSSGPRVRTLLFGDSVAFTLAFAHDIAYPSDSDPLIDLRGEASIGCGILISQEVSSSSPLPSYCKTGTPASEQWPAIWQKQVDQFRPQVTVLLVGRWETFDNLIDGRWMHIGQPRFDSILKHDLERAVQIGTSTGALMILERPPCSEPEEQLDGEPSPDGTPGRLRAFDAMLQRVAAEHPRTVAIGDLGDRMCPGGVFEPVVDGVRIRSADGIHVAQTRSAGLWVATVFDPEIVAVGRLQQQGRDLTGRTSTEP